jgi:hypothetical protein
MQARTQLTNAVNALPLILAVLGIAVPLVGSNFIVWQLSLLWLLVVVVVVLAVRRARPPRSTRVFWGLVALPMLFLLGWEGGWWLIPAVVAEVALDAWAA